jgi:hypothetical protein
MTNHRMKFVALIIIVIAASVLLRMVRARQIQDGTAKSKFGGGRADPSMYMGLRDLALHNSPAPPEAAMKPNERFAVIMDWGVTNGTATVAAFADGTASIYLSGGGGFLGGGQAHESIRNFAKQMVRIAGETMPLMQRTTSYPLPAQGQVTFYARTPTGIFTATTSEEELRTHRSRLSNLVDTAQAIITEYRRIQPEGGNR